jgi:hypothetical protein
VVTKVSEEVTLSIFSAEERQAAGKRFQKVKIRNFITVKTSDIILERSYTFTHPPTKLSTVRLLADTCVLLKIAYIL